ncbi:hypothetical protein PMI26_05692 [Pseudomonas sp. GM33]|uniref:hypothetical protein n=1 Tax=Pseudomonas sp. GM33 TaxID=1144329 RepID=UPI00026FF1E7|nr:hypothetical protein [Pseudomonas sp. GM33]EJM34485.1 hypothetical protein PMI26_05692 [Pseudomonas sp. GM33]
MGKWVERIHGVFGNIDIIVHAAAIFLFTLFENLIVPENRVVEVGMNGTFHCYQTTYRHMRIAQWTNRNFALGDALLGLVNAVVYATSKTGAIGRIRPHSECTLNS